MDKPRNYDKPNSPEQGGAEGNPAEPKVKAKPADPTGPLPRVIDPSERAVEGTTRFKIGCRNYGDIGPIPTLYILAKSGKGDKAEDKAEEEAGAFYLNHVGLTKKFEAINKDRARAMKASGKTQKDVDEMDPLEPAALSFTVLKD